MAFSPNVMKAFDAWIRVDTWHTGHALDEKRFYRFVWAVLEYSRRKPSEADVFEAIIRAHGGQFEATFLEQKARHYANLYLDLHAFAKARNRWR